MVRLGEIPLDSTRCSSPDTGPTLQHQPHGLFYSFSDLAFLLLLTNGSLLRNLFCSVRNAAAQVDALCQPTKGSKQLEFAHSHATSFIAQLRLLLGRSFRTYWRLPQYNVLRFIVTLIMGLFFGTLFLDRGAHRWAVRLRVGCCDQF